MNTYRYFKNCFESTNYKVKVVVCLFIVCTVNFLILSIPSIIPPDTTASIEAALPPPIRAPIGAQPDSPNIVKKDPDIGNTPNEHNGQAPIPLRVVSELSGDKGPRSTKGATPVTPTPPKVNIDVTVMNPPSKTPAVVQNAKISSPPSPAPTVIAKESGLRRQRPLVKKKALLFTMDSISSYEVDSKKGGAAGELLIRHSLETAFKELGVALTVCTSDQQFGRMKGTDFDILIVDPWTWAGKGWVAKPQLKGFDHKVYVLDFFGHARLPGNKLQVPDERFLTAFGGSPKNSFLGYFYDDSTIKKLKSVKKNNQGVIWGKDPRHYSGKLEVLKAIADVTILYSTCTKKLFDHPNVHWIGHVSPDQWGALLAESKFLLGLGDPLLGPSAIDAIMNGCMYINPIYDIPKEHHGAKFHSQHPFAASHFNKSIVCSASFHKPAQVLTCVKSALASTATPSFEPLPALALFQHDAYMGRVKSIFNI